MKLMQDLEVYKSYQDSKYLSIKHSSYFQVYEELFAKYRNRKLIFVEIGVLNGGSLFMWRNFFGPDARIIGVDLNPGAKRWEADGFEIHIGSQSDENFWEEFFTSIGAVDIVLDDGGHTNEQQIVTTHMCIPHIKDEGMLVVEDVHASYMKSFDNPSKYSFINYTKRLIDSINSRFPAVKVPSHPFKEIIYSISTFESIVAFNVNRQKCFISTETTNSGIPMQAQDFRNVRTGAIQYISTNLSFIKKIPPAKFIAKFILSLSTSRRICKYFY